MQWYLLRQEWTMNEKFSLKIVQESVQTKILFTKTEKE